jgi:hypothetical protein
VERDLTILKDTPDADSKLLPTSSILKELAAVFTTTVLVCLTDGATLRAGYLIRPAALLNEVAASLFVRKSV